MLPYRNTRRNHDDATPDEVREALEVRLSTLDQVVFSNSIGVAPAACERWGWTAKLEWLRRDRSGCKRFRVVVEGPGLANPYVRNVRLVKERALPRGLRLG